MYEMLYIKLHTVLHSIAYSSVSGIKNVLYTGIGPTVKKRLLHIGFLIFRVCWIDPQAFSFGPSLADAN